MGSAWTCDSLGSVLWVRCAPFSSSCLCPDIAGSSPCLVRGGLFLSVQVTQVIGKALQESNGFDVLGDKPQV